MLRGTGRQSPSAVTFEKALRRPAQHTFIGRQPLQANLSRECEHFVRDTAFRGPHPGRTLSERVFVKVESPAHLLECIVSLQKSPPGQRKPWAAYAAIVRVAE